MSVQAMAWAMDQRVVTDASARHVLLILANYADQAGRGAHPSIGTIVRQTGLAERTVQMKIEHLLSTATIVPGNAALVEVNIARGDRRPKVYDLVMFAERGAAIAPREAERGATTAPRKAPRGAKTAPRAAERGANDDATGCKPCGDGVQLTTERGAVVAPDPSLNHPKNHPGTIQAVPAEDLSRFDFPDDPDIARMEAALRDGVPDEAAEPAALLPMHPAAVIDTIAIAVIPDEPKPAKTPRAQKMREPEFQPPAWVPREAWDGWLEMRRKQRIPNTDRALKAAVKILDALVAKGWDAEAVIDLATCNGWRSFYEPRDQSLRTGSGKVVPIRAEQSRRGLDALLRASTTNRSTIDVRGASVSGPAHLLARIQGTAK